MVTIQDLSSQRVPLLTSVTCTSEADSRPMILSMLDLSEGGIFIQTSYPLDLGTKVKCSFNMGDGPESIEVLTEVAWTRPGPPNMEPAPGMGLRFLNLTEEQLFRIRSVIEKHSEYMHYYSQFGRIPEDAMALSPPKLSLTSDNNSVKAVLKSISGTNLLATVALPFFKVGNKLEAEMENGGFAETGRISWLNFTTNNTAGVPEMQVGIELSLNSWGEEPAKRFTKPMGTYRQANETEVEVLDEIPASFTMAPTLPLKEEDSAPVPSKQELFESSEQSLFSEPHEKKSQNSEPLPAPPIQNEIPVPPVLRNTIAMKTETENPAPFYPDISDKMQFPAPLFKSDTYPITGAASWWPFTTKATVLMMLGAFLIMGLIGALFSDSVPYNNTFFKKAEATPVSKKDFVKPEQQIPFTKGNPINIKIAAASVPIITNKSNNTPEKQKIENTPEKQNNEIKKIPAEQIKPFALITKGKRTILKFGTSSSKLKTTYYELASPPGIVLNVKKGKLLQPKGYLKVKNRKIRKIKILDTSFGSRAIIYTRKKPDKIRISYKSGKISVSFN